MLKGDADRDAMSARIRALDWSRTPLGAAADWPACLSVSVATILESPVPMCILWGRDHIQIYNDAMRPLYGPRHPAALGQALRDTWPHFPDLYRSLYATVWSGESVHRRRERMADRRGGEAGEAWFDLAYSPIRDARGKVAGILHIVTEVTDRVVAEQHQQLLIDELHHRVKNMLATVQAVATSTARGATSVAAFQHAFGARLHALGKTHELLTTGNWQAIGLAGLLGAELEPYRDAAGARIALDGAAVDLPARIAVPLAMAIHELATNAAKYGALSADAGSVAVAWSEEGGRLRLNWRERGGPPVEIPGREGFGSLLLRRVLTAQIKADVTLDYAREGLAVDIAIPLG